MVFPAGSCRGRSNVLIWGVLTLPPFHTQAPLPHRETGASPAPSIGPKRRSLFPLSPQEGGWVHCSPYFWQRAGRELAVRPELGVRQPGLRGSVGNPSDWRGNPVLQAQLIEL